MALAWTLTATFLSAANGNWTATVSGDWGDPDNWQGVTIPGTDPGDVVTISNAITGTVTVTLDDTYTVGELSFGNVGGMFLLNRQSTTVGGLIMDNDGEQAVINLLQTSGANNAAMITAALYVTDGGLKIHKGTTGSNLAVAGTITNTTNDLQWLTFSASQTGNYQINSVISDGSGENSQLAVLVDGTSTPIFLNGNNSFSGGVLLRNGTLRANHNGFGTGVVTLGDAQTTGNITFNTTGVQTFQNDIVVSSATGTHSVIIQAPDGSANVEYAGNVDVQKSLTLSLISGGRLTFSGSLSGAGHITIASNNLNSGYVELSGDNSLFSGGITANAYAILKIAHHAALGTGKLILKGAERRLDSTADIVISTSPDIDWEVDFTYLGSHSLNLGTGAVTLKGSGAIRKVTVNDSVLGFDGAIGGAYGLTKDGAGTLELNGVNTYSGDTVIEAGTLQGRGSIAGGLTIGDGSTDAILSTASSNAAQTQGSLTVQGSLSLHEDATLYFVFDSDTGEFGRIIANGISIDANSQFALFDLGSSVVSKDTVFVVMENTSENAIGGTFLDLEEGAMIGIGDNLFQVSYLGGSGNDFVLTSIPEPATSALLSVLGVFGLVMARRIQKRRSA